MNLEQERIDILHASADGRERDVMHYQINIDNYRLAIAEIEANHADDAALTTFANNLRELLASSLVEQGKERILLKVIRSQLEATCTSS
jgi:hypothetical protein